LFQLQRLFEMIRLVREPVVQQTEGLRREAGRLPPCEGCCDHRPQQFRGQGVPTASGDCRRPQYLKLMDHQVALAKAGVTWGTGTVIWAGRFRI
jgi:hypothetical protein